MLLTVDVGNTSTSFCLYKITSSVPHKPLRTWILGTPEIAEKKFSTLINKIRSQKVRHIFVSSVVPSVDSFLKTAFQKKINVSPHFVSAQTKSKVKINYLNPREVGADRIVNARAAMSMAKGASIVIDFGTATTFDCVSAKGEYLGGVIAPGPAISAEALYQKTAKLPHVLLVRPAKILGRNTLQSIQSGLYHGYRGLVREIIAELKTVLGPRTTILATGGQSDWILKGTNLVDKTERYLTHMGLYLMWQDSQINARKMVDFTKRRR